MAYILATSLPLGLLSLRGGIAYIEGVELHTLRACNGLHCSKTNFLKVTQIFLIDPVEAVPMLEGFPRMPTGPVILHRTQKAFAR